MSQNKGDIIQITGVPAPYRLPLYRRATELLRQTGRGFMVLFTGIGLNRQWEISQQDFHGIAYRRLGGGGKVRLLRHLTAAIRSARPSAVVLGWAMDAVALAVLLYCRLRRIPCLLWTGENANALNNRSYPALRKLSRKPFFRLASAFITYGSSATAYVAGNGVDRSRIFTAINVVDTAFFRQSADALRQSGAHLAQRDNFRGKDGQPFACHFMFVGYLLRNKGVFHTVQALAALGRADVCLHLLGAGRDEEELRACVAQLGLQHQVIFHGYVQKADLVRFYALADAVVFPSLPKMSEVFGLVMVEAAACALPVVGSVYAGGTVDVVEHGVNGLIVDPLDIAAYAHALGRLAADPALRRSMGQASRRKSLAELTVERATDGYMNALRFVLNESNAPGEYPAAVHAADNTKQ